MSLSPVQHVGRYGVAGALRNKIGVQLANGLSIRPTHITVLTGDNSRHPGLRTTDALTNLDLRQTAMNADFRDKFLPVHTAIIAFAIIKSTPMRYFK